MLFLFTFWSDAGLLVAADRLIVFGYVLKLVDKFYGSSRKKKYYILKCKKWKKGARIQVKEIFRPIASVIDSMKRAKNSILPTQNSNRS